MAKLIADISMSLDGYVAGPNPTVDEPLGRGGEGLHEWAVGLASWRESHGQPGGDQNVDDEVMRETLSNVGAVLMGRRMFSGGAGRWEDDPVADGWWGDEPPFGVPVFVLTHHARETVTKKGGTSFTFVTDGIEAALDQARAAAADRNISVAGGASIIQQYVRAGLLDELHIHQVPVLLGGGVRLLDNLADAKVGVEISRVIGSPTVTHLRYALTPRT